MGDTENIRFRSYDELLENKEEFNEDYIYTNWAGNQKKQDTKVIEERIIMSREEVKDFLEKNLAAKKPYYNIKSELLDNGVMESVIENVFLETLKDIQLKKVSDLRKQGKFTPEMTKEQLSKKKKEMDAKNASEKPAAAAPGKKDSKKK